MWEKIKSAFMVLLRGMFMSKQGFAGAVMVFISMYFLVEMFTGVASVQNYVKNRRSLNAADSKIEGKTDDLALLNLHIKLLQDVSPDFVAEMAAKYLNLGDPKTLLIKK